MLAAQLCSTLCDPWTVAHQALLSMEFSRQEYWNGLPYPISGNFLSGMEPGSPALQEDSLPSEPPGKPMFLVTQTLLTKNINITYTTKDQPQVFLQKSPSQWIKITSGASSLTRKNGPWQKGPSPSYYTLITYSCLIMLIKECTVEENESCLRDQNEAWILEWGPTRQLKSRQSIRVVTIKRRQNKMCW